MSFFKKKLISWGESGVRAKYVHMRYCAYILNLLVQEGLKDMHVSVKRIRDVVRYIKNSPARLSKFREYSNLIGVELKCSLCLDVPTRWNSTYLMLQNACEYEKIFEKYEENETALRSDLGDDVLEYLDWKCAKNLLKFLENFYNITLRIYGSQYVTSNTFFSEIAELFYLLNRWKKFDDAYVRSMGLEMKYDDVYVKYYGDGDKINYLILAKPILSPLNL